MCVLVFVCVGGCVCLPTDNEAIESQIRTLINDVIGDRDIFGAPLLAMSPSVCACVLFSPPRLREQSVCVCVLHPKALSRLIHHPQDETSACFH